MIASIATLGGDVKLIRIAPHATHIVSDAAARADARARYTRDFFLPLEGFLDPELLAAVKADIAAGAFHGIDACGTEERMENGRAFDRMEFLLNDPALHAFVSEVTGCGPIGCYQGRIYRMGSEHRAEWHNDVYETRLVALTINVSERPFEGGGVAIRHLPSGDVHEAPAPGIGDALIFRIGEDLTHRNTDIVGEGKKTAIAGWFRREPQFADRLFAAFGGRRG